MIEYKNTKEHYLSIKTIQTKYITIADKVTGEIGIDRHEMIFLPGPKDAKVINEKLEEVYRFGLGLIYNMKAEISTMHVQGGITKQELGQYVKSLNIGQINKYQNDTDMPEDDTTPEATAQGILENISNIYNNSLNLGFDNNGLGLKPIPEDLVSKTIIKVKTVKPRLG